MISFNDIQMQRDFEIFGSVRFHVTCMESSRLNVDSLRSPLDVNFMNVYCDNILMLCMLRLTSYLHRNAA